MASKNVSRKITISINGKEVEASLNGIGKEIGRLNKELRATTDPAERKKLNDELKNTKKRYREINEEIRGTPSLFDQIKKQLGPVGVAMGAAFSGAAVLSFANKIVDTIKLFGDLRQETKALTGLQGEVLNEAVGATKALSDTFDTDFKENLIAANTLSKQFGVTYEEALESIEKGYLAGANASGDMLNQIKEYAPLMKEANLEMDEMVALITQTTKEGLFNDKGIDAIKEGMLSIREGTKATVAAMQGLGIDTKKVYADLANGSIDYFDAMQMVSEKLSEVEEQSPEVGTAIADIFKGAGEDAGLDFLQGIKDIDLELNNLIDTTDEYVAAQKLEVEANRELNTALAELTETGSWWNVMLSNMKLSAGQALSATSALIETNVSGWTKVKAALGDVDAIRELSIQRSKELAENQKINDAIQAKQIEENEKINTEKATQAEKDRLNKKAQLQREAESKRAKSESDADAKRAKDKADRDREQNEKELEKLREFQGKYDLEQEKLKQESAERAKELEAQNKLDQEALKLENEALSAATEEERVNLMIERARYVATQQLEIEKERDIQRAILANATEEELAAIRQKYVLAEQKVNQDYTEDKKSQKDQEVTWENMATNQKLDLVRGGLNQAAELFNKNTGAYKAIKIVETLMTTYQAAMNAYNSLSVIPIVGPALGAVAAAAAVSTGLAQVSKIKSTKEEKMPRYNLGGFTTGLGFTDHSGHQVAGVVHADEYVVPKFIAQDPVYADTIGFLEQKRIQGLGKGYADGGTVEPVNMNSSNDQLVETLRRLSGQLENGIYATALIGDDEIVKQKARENKLVQTRESAKIS